MLLLLKATHRGLWKLCLETHKANKHALLHMKNNSEWDIYCTNFSLYYFPHTAYFSEGVLGRRTPAHAWEVFMRTLRRTSCVAQAMATKGARGYSCDVGCFRKSKKVNCCVVLCAKTHRLATHSSTCIKETTQQQHISFDLCLLQSKRDEIHKWKWPFLNYSHRMIVACGFQTWPFSISIAH